MENTIGIPEAVLITQSVANFLMNTERYNTAIEFYKEVLTLAKIIENITSVSDGLILDIQEHTHLSLGYAYSFVGNHDESKANAKLALQISQKIGDKNVEQQSCCCLFWGFEALGQYDKAIKYLEKAAEICKAIGDSQTEAKYDYLLGKIYFDIGQHEKATEYFLKSIKVSKAIGQRKMEADALLHLGRVFADLGKLEESSQKQQEALRIYEEIGDDSGRAQVLTFLGETFQRKGHYDKSLEFLQNSLRVSREKHDKEGEGNTCLYLGLLLVIQGNYQEADKYLERVVEISNLTGNSEMMEIACNCLSNVKLLLGQPDKAAGYKERAMKGLREAGPGKFTPVLALLSLVTGRAAGNVHQELDVLAESIRFFEGAREPLSDEYKLSLGERFQNVACDKLHSYFLLKGGQKLEALLAAERGRARVLEEMLRKKYAIQEKIESVNESTLNSFIGSLTKEQVLVFLAALFPETPTETPAKTFFISWVMTNEEGPKVELFLSKEDLSKIRIRDLEGMVLGNFRSLVNGEDVECEDRSLSAFYDSGSKADDEEEGKRAGVRLVESDDEEDEENKKDTLLYDMLIAPIADRIEGREVVLVPEGFMFMVPFPALQDGNGKYLSETCKIRIIPSLTTLKLIKDSAADYHSQAGVLIVGDPDVSRVRGLGQLPAARQEAEEISKLLNVSPLLGQQATKKEVLRRITDTCLIHIAAHGDAERGEIACSPSLSSPGAPRKEDFVLTMADIANVGIRAKLVVLSCCHSGRGKIMTSEGAVGIARAFITSGARSVLVSLWLLNDESTREFMIRFYGHLVCDKMSTSEALHQSMKWMRESKKYSVSDWAPFVLIGDDVTLDL